MKLSSAKVLSLIPVLRWVVRALLLAWAGFWAWFVVAVSIGESPAPPWWIPAAWLASLAALVVLCWRRPTLGGLVLAGSGILAAVAFDNPWARLLLAAPALVLGVASLALGRGARGLAHAALFLCSLSLVACCAPQDPADLPFRTSSILRHENGQMKRAFLVEETELEGFPCRRWTWWYDDGRLDNLELSRELTFKGNAAQGHRFPAHTRLFFDREGRLAHAWLSEDSTIDGWPCRGGMKIDTAFHPEGTVRAFFPPDPIEIDGVLCVASVFHPVYLHPDGRLRECKLARAATIAGHTYAKGEVLQLAGPETVAR